MHEAGWIVKRLLLLVFLASLAASEARAGESLGGACPNGYETLSGSAVLICSSGAWALGSLQIGQKIQIAGVTGAGAPVVGTGSTETDPQVSTLTASQWCKANAGGTAIDCTTSTPSTAAAGSSGYVQFNNSNAFAADSNLFWDNTNKRLGVGTSSPAYKFVVVTTGGTAYLSDGGVWVNASDRRLKTNIQPIQYGLGAVMALNPVSYTMRANGLKQIGFIAQEVEQVIPELVDKVKTTDMDDQRTLSYDQMAAVTVSAIQELSRINDDQALQIQSLEERIHELEASAIGQVRSSLPMRGGR